MLIAQWQVDKLMLSNNSQMALIKALLTKSKVNQVHPKIITFKLEVMAHKETRL